MFLIFMAVPQAFMERKKRDEIRFIGSIIKLVDTLNFTNLRSKKPFCGLYKTQRYAHFWTIFSKKANEITIIRFDSIFL